MLVVRHSSTRRVSAVLVRSLTTETYNSTPEPPPPPPPKRPTARPRTSLYPQPRPAVSQQLPSLPPTFGRNQLLPVSNSTRALLESIVEQFDAPIRYAFAYGSGVFEQDSYPASSTAADAPMLDFMFAVTHPAHFHSINMQQHPSHYTLHGRVLGSSYISRMQELGPGVWFNTMIPMGGVTIKYGVTTVDTLCSDLLNWRSLYLAGRMHKPLRISQGRRALCASRSRSTSPPPCAPRSSRSPPTSPRRSSSSASPASATSATRACCSPRRTAARCKTSCASRPRSSASCIIGWSWGCPAVHWPAHAATIQQDVTPHARAAHLRKLPSNLLAGVRNNYSRAAAAPSYEADESAYWIRLAGDERLPVALGEELKRIVRYPATVQTLKGLSSAGLGKSFRYWCGQGWQMVERIECRGGK
ncbi:mitochondrial matrix Mmp37-domain-containing protein [Mycena rebaudengoi]|nr:mitochondrial matrix Mmp37-domain-containing protein [Mycena rebaudengoi]